MMEPEQRLRHNCTLTRQSSWSGLSESSSHESLTGPLVKSSSLNSMKMSAESKKQRVLITLRFKRPFPPFEEWLYVVRIKH